MSSENLQKMFVEDAPQQVNELTNVKSLSTHVLELQKLEDEIKEDEERLKLKKQGADKLSGEVIPEIMESISSGITSPESLSASCFLRFNLSSSSFISSSSFCNSRT